MKSGASREKISPVAEIAEKRAVPMAQISMAWSPKMF